MLLFCCAKIQRAYKASLKAIKTYHQQKLVNVSFVRTFAGMSGPNGLAVGGSFRHRNNAVFCFSVPCNPINETFVYEQIVHWPILLTAIKKRLSLNTGDSLLIAG
jgi:hypothetical protein